MSLDDAKDHTNKFWRYGKLGDLIEDQEPQTNWGPSDSRRRWGNWQKFLQVSRESPKFLNGLSGPQRRAAKILLDWHSGAYQTTQDRDFSAAFLEGNSELLVPAGSDYQKFMTKLFNHEFDLMSWYNHRPNRLLHFQMTWTYRQHASTYAAAQQLAFSSLQAKTPSPRVSLGSPTLDGPSLGGCPWLVDKYLELESPTYLWDIPHAKTVEVKDLDTCPQYTCVSHTWGRLRNRDAPYIQVKYVPWKVPQIMSTSYIVEELPDLFKKLEWKTNYLWIDLFCIPQEQSWQEITEKEIGRQTHIFGRCHECVVWLNDITSQWNGLGHAIKWLGRKYLSENGPPSDLRNLMAAPSIESYNSPRTNIEFLADPSAATGVKKYALWFSSTWTVQEAFLCPHMVIVNKDWWPLTDGNGHLVPLGSLLSLAKHTKAGLRMVDEDKLIKDAIPAQQLQKWMDDTYLDSITNPKQSRILAMGARRECSGNRAKAVMSVLDVLDWPDRITNTAKGPKNDLIREAYSHGFIQEAAQRIGAQFYNFISGKIEDVDAFVANPVFGTMMPFSKPLDNQHEMEATEEFLPIVTEHPAVSSWKINAKGQVKITRAGILGHVRAPGQFDFGLDKAVDKVGFNTIAFTHRIPGFYSLRDILDRFSMVKSRPDLFRPTYVISLFVNVTSLMHYCTILQGRARRREDGPIEYGHMDLVRTAVLHSQGWVDLPPDTQVNWTVL